MVAFEVRLLYSCGYSVSCNFIIAGGARYL